MMIIRPTKHSHPDKTVIYASFLMLKELKKKRLVPYSKLLTLVKDNITSGEYLFAPALNFLFLLGLVEYQPKTDMLEFIENRP
ncbi:ABC-three component system middle component 8 [Psychrobacter sp. UBA3480]|uniref:ABC-three component system middle component 8 n=2 Tax=Psychrobacter TaxID=497 RepID=UPI0032E4AABF